MYKVYLCNYSSNPFNKREIGEVGQGYGSLGVSFANGGGIPILPQDYIGIYVETVNRGVIAPKIIITGTLYFSRKRA